jgi:2-dehydro-3-deoxygluconokinase
VTAALVTLGEAMLRLWAPRGQRLEDAATLHVSVAGAEANVAIAAARMGIRTVWMSRVPDSPLGRRVLSEIGRHGVDVSHVRTVQSGRLGTFFVEAGVPPRPGDIVYDRAGSAASELSVDDLAWDVIQAASIVHLTGITPALSPQCRETTFVVAQRARAAGVKVSVDVNYRAKLWAPAEAATVLDELCRLADIVIVNDEDARDVFGIAGDAPSVLDQLAARFGVTDVVLSHGPRGASWRSKGVNGQLPAMDTEVVDRLGAGDAFAGGVLVGALEGDLGKGVAYGAVMAAVKLGLQGDQLRTSRAEVERLLTGDRRTVTR